MSEVNRINGNRKDDNGYKVGRGKLLDSMLPKAKMGRAVGWGEVRISALFGIQGKWGLMN